MKFLCKTEFFHSGKRLYTTGTVYSDITLKVAEELIAVDKNIPLGALSFFTPVDEEAINFVKGKKVKNTAPDDPANTGNPDPQQPKEPTKTDLIKEAKGLGIKATNFMSIEQLKEVIEAARKAQQSPPMGTGNPDPQA